MRVSIAKTIVGLRRYCGLSQKHIARRSGVPLKQIKSIETEEKVPSELVLHKLSTAGFGLKSNGLVELSESGWFR